MIVSDEFVWLHFPKCAGHAVEQALRSVLRSAPDVAFDRPGDDTINWHDTLEDRRRRDPRLALGERTVVCGFRRLPHWMLSRVHYEASRPPYHCVTRAMLCRGEFFHQNGQVGKADAYVEHYGASKVDRWVRTEHLLEDFERAFGDMMGSRLARGALRRARRIVNGTRLNYMRRLDFYFTGEELAALYAANPLWAELERRLYGDILRIAEVDERPFYFVDWQLNFVTANPTALRTWGLSAEEVLGRHMLDVFPLARSSPPYEAHLLALRTKEEIRLKTVSPTYAEPVEIAIHPSQAGLKVSFERLKG